ncbi:MAG TPA: Hint domain-containing protein [Thermomicrobiales bacterium]|nr:Hint domain-containing protein [Thermomicrobiales bacterium]
MALMGGVIRNANTHNTLVFASACITGTFTCYGTDGQGIWNNLKDNATTGYEGVSITCSAGGFYPSTVNLVAADIAFYPGIGYGYWKVVELTPQPQPETCFTGDTLVTMADGSTRPIATIAIDDRVLGQDGSIGRVLDIDMPTLGDRLLYGVNGETPFVTSEHPFMTDRGWAAIDPGATARENPDLPVVKLRAGDRLHCLASARVPAMSGAPADRADVAILPRRLDTIVSTIGDSGQRLYNLILDGDHTYFANGYLVHNKTSSH